MRTSKCLFGIFIFLISSTGFTQAKEISCQGLHEQLGKVRIVDVRTPEEFVGLEGHIPGAELVTLGPELSEFLAGANSQERIVFVCRSGRRSMQAVEQSLQLGYEHTLSLKGGMIEWKASGFPTEKK